MNRIIEIAHLAEYLARDDISNTSKADAVKCEIKNGTITADEGLELILEYTK